MILPAFMVHDTRSRNPVVIKRAEGTQAKNGCRRYVLNCFEIIQVDLKKSDLSPALSVAATEVNTAGIAVRLHDREGRVRLQPIKPGVRAKNESLFDPSLPAVHRGDYNSISSLFFLNNSARCGR